MRHRFFYSVLLFLVVVLSSFVQCDCPFGVRVSWPMNSPPYVNEVSVLVLIVLSRLLPKIFVDCQETRWRIVQASEVCDCVHFV